MSVEEHKRVHLKIHEGIWMNRNLDLVEEVIGEQLAPEMGGGTMTIQERKAMLQKAFANQDATNHRVVRTEYHAKIGEGDWLAVWQTNYHGDGSSSEEVNLFKFKDGKSVGIKSFKLPERKPENG